MKRENGVNFKKAAARCEMFAGIDETTLHKLYENGQTELFKKGDELYRSGNLGCLICGRAIIRAKNGSAVMRDISAGDIFGFVSFFGNGNFRGCVVAAEECSVVYINEGDIKDLIDTNEVFRLNYIRFLTDRLKFLNEKIAGFTTAGADERVLSALADYSDENGVVVLPFKMTELANRLNVSRSGMYRAIGSLTEKGKIKKCGNKFVLCGKYGL